MLLKEVLVKLKVSPFQYAFVLDRRKFVVKTFKSSKRAMTSVAAVVVHVWEDGR